MPSSPPCQYIYTSGYRYCRQLAMASELLGSDSGGLAGRRNLQVMSPSLVPVQMATAPGLVQRTSSRSRSANRAATSPPPTGTVAGRNASPQSSNAGRNSTLAQASSTRSEGEARRSAPLQSGSTTTTATRVKSEGPSQGRNVFESLTKAVLRSEVDLERNRSTTSRCTPMCV